MRPPCSSASSGGDTTELEGFCEEVGTAARIDVSAAHEPLLIRPAVDTRSRTAYLQVTNLEGPAYFTAYFENVEGTNAELPASIPVRWENQSGAERRIDREGTANLELGRTRPEPAGALYLASPDGQEIAAFLPVDESDPDFAKQWFSTDLRLVVRITWAQGERKVALAFGIDQHTLAPRVKVVE